MNAATPRIIVVPECAQSARDIPSNLASRRKTRGVETASKPLETARDCANCRKALGIYAVHAAVSLDRGQELTAEPKCLQPASPQAAEKLQNHDNRGNSARQAEHVVDLQMLL
jgi:hypothetical protein